MQLLITAAKFEYTALIDDKHLVTSLQYGQRSNRGVDQREGNDHGRTKSPMSITATKAFMASTPVRTLMPSAIGLPMAIVARLL
jgi:hypothetical protein